MRSKERSTDLPNSHSYSVIIPTINEQAGIAHAIESAWKAGADEVIVCDGGSNDQTCQIAGEQECKLVHSEAGRAVQLNEGARAATGDVLLFVHADNSLPHGACRQIDSAFANPDLLWGAFRQRIDSKRWVYRWIERGNAARIRWRSMAYGDQGIFVRRPIFQDIGGFDHVRLLEDVLLSQRLRKLVKPVLLPGPLIVSDRRWETRGVIRQTLANWRILIRFNLGVSPDHLAQEYLPHQDNSSSI